MVYFNAIQMIPFIIDSFNIGYFGAPLKTNYKQENTLNIYLIYSTTILTPSVFRDTWIF